MSTLDLRPIVLGMAAWAGAWAATSGEPAWWVAGASLAALVAVVAATRRSRAWLAVALMLAVALGCGVLRTTQLAGGTVADLARESAVVEADVVLQGGARVFEASATRPESWVSGAVLTALRGRGESWASGVPVELSATGEQVLTWQGLAAGTTVRVLVRLSAPDPDAGLAALARARGAPTVLAPPGPVDAAVAGVRSGLRTASAGLPADARGLVPALVVGDTSTVDADLKARFKTTGLTHLTAVSGANLVLLLAFVRAVVVGLGGRGRVVNGVLLGTVFGFVALCNAEPSVVRAAAMGLVGLIALGSGQQGRHGLRYLWVAVLALTLWDPWISRSIGFALSVLASAGLLVWAGRWTSVLSRWAPGFVAEAVAVPLAAQLATQPLVTAISGQVSLVGVLANAAAGPLVGPATVSGFLGAAASVVSVPLAAVVLWPAGWCAQGLSWIARLGSALPGAAVGWPVTWYSVVVLTLLCVLAGLLAHHVLGNRWVVVGVAVALITALARTPTPPGWPPAAWSIVSCDVGQGDATVIRAGPGQAVVVDAGPDPGLLRRCLDQLGVVSVPMAVITHLHADHVTGLPVLAARGLEVVVTSTVATPASGELLVEAAVAGGVHQVKAETGSAWQVGAARVDVLAADALALEEGVSEGESSAENDASLLVRVTVDGVSLLLAGDSQEAGQGLHATLGEGLDVDVLLVPHHGSSHQDPAFLAATTPEIALISVGAKNDYGHPTKKTLTTVGALTPNILRTDEHGSIAIARDQGRLVVTTQR